MNIRIWGLSYEKRPKNDHLGFAYFEKIDLYKIEYGDPPMRKIQKKRLAETDLQKKF